MSQREIELVYQTVLSDNHGNPDLALRDLAHRFVSVMRGVSPGFLRWNQDDPPRDVRIDDVPNPITDDWIRTGVDA